MDPTVALFLERFREIHQRFRVALEALAPTLLGVSPAPEASSPAVLVQHTLGSQADVLRTVAGLPVVRDRAVEFRVSPDLDRTDLLAALDEADRMLEEVGPRITAERLRTTIERPPRPPRTGLGWLVHNHGHVCEHLAHLELTVQVLARKTE